MKLRFGCYVFTVVPSFNGSERNKKKIVNKIKLGKRVRDEYEMNYFRLNFNGVMGVGLYCHIFVVRHNRNVI